MRYAVNRTYKWLGDAENGKQQHGNIISVAWYKAKEQVCMLFHSQMIHQDVRQDLTAEITISISIGGSGCIGQKSSVPIIEKQLALIGQVPKKAWQLAGVVWGRLWKIVPHFLSLSLLFLSSVSLALFLLQCLLYLLIAAPFQLWSTNMSYRPRYTCWNLGKSASSVSFLFPLGLFLPLFYSPSLLLPRLHLSWYYYTLCFDYLPVYPHAGEQAHSLLDAHTIPLS